MKWPWGPRRTNGELDAIPRVYPGSFIWKPTKEQILKRVERFEEMAENTSELPQPNFTGSLITAIELLKRGAVVVDMHEWNMRLRRASDTWSISSIPIHARQLHAQMELNDQLEHTQPPIDGEEATDGEPGATAGVGAAPENA